MFEVTIAGETFVVASAAVGREASGSRELSVAENDVAADAAAGLSNAAIARKRGRSTRTIANQLAAVYRKLGVSSRSELAVRLYRR